jgi:hypothetical protein
MMATDSEEGLDVGNKRFSAKLSSQPGKNVGLGNIGADGSRTYMGRVLD